MSAHLEKLSLDFSSSMFEIHDNLTHPYNHPVSFMVYYYLCVLQLKGKFGCGQNSSK